MIARQTLSTINGYTTSRQVTNLRYNPGCLILILCFTLLLPCLSLSACLSVQAWCQVPASLANHLVYLTSTSTHLDPAVFIPWSFTIV